MLQCCILAPHCAARTCLVAQGSLSNEDLNATEEFHDRGPGDYGHEPSPSPELGVFYGSNRIATAFSALRRAGSPGIHPVASSPAEPQQKLAKLESFLVLWMPVFETPEEKQTFFCRGDPSRTCHRRPVPTGTDLQGHVRLGSPRQKILSGCLKPAVEKHLYLREFLLWHSQRRADWA